MKELERILKTLGLATLGVYEAKATFNKQWHRLFVYVNDVLIVTEEGREFTKDELAHKAIEQLVLSGCISNYDLNKNKSTHIKQNV